MITLNKNSLKYKDSDGNMRDSGVLFASDGENNYATREELDQLSEEIDEQNKKISQLEISIGDVSTMLDTVIAMQEQYIGGES